MRVKCKSMDKPQTYQCIQENLPSLSLSYNNQVKNPQVGMDNAALNRWHFLSPVLLRLLQKCTLLSSRWTWPWVRKPSFMGKPCYFHLWSGPRSPPTFHPEHQQQFLWPSASHRKYEVYSPLALGWVLSTSGWEGDISEAADPLKGARKGGWIVSSSISFCDDSVWT